MNGFEDLVIVLAEDDPAHASLIEKSLRSVPASQLVKFGNGCDALAYLRVEDPASRPRLLLLDLNMPVMDGYQALRHLKADPRTARIPVIALTTTEDPVGRCFELGCDACVVKSPGYGELAEAIRRLRQPGVAPALAGLPMPAGSKRGRETRL